MQADTNDRPWSGSAPAVRSVRFVIGLLVGMEAVLAAWMAGLVWGVTRDPKLFPRVSRHLISIPGAAAATSLAVYCAVLAVLVLSSLGGLTPSLRALGRSARRIHLTVAVVASVVWLWTGWPWLDAVDVLFAVALVAGALAWSQLIAWCTTPRMQVQ